jgi:4a-hydroxytetrahydrobiopterin dehydratase
VTFDLSYQSLGETAACAVPQLDVRPVAERATSHPIPDRVPSIEMLTGEQIAKSNLTDWRKLGQGIHARYVVDDFGTGARFVAAVGEAGDALGHHPRVTIGDGYVDFKLVSDNAVYRDDEGTEHVVEWVTQRDVELAQRITEIAAEQKVDADPASITAIELALDTAHSATIARCGRPC